eukprot:2630619-Rhodomonas_salina.3
MGRRTQWEAGETSTAMRWAGFACLAAVCVLFAVLPSLSPAVNRTELLSRPQSIHLKRPGFHPRRSQLALSHSPQMAQSGLVSSRLARAERDQSLRQRFLATKRARLQQLP